MVVMVVDDDPGARQLALDHLRHSGFEALAASTGQEALALLRQNHRIVFIFVNFSIRGEVDADRLAVLAQEYRPQLPVLQTHALGEMVRLATPSLDRIIARP